MSRFIAHKYYSRNFKLSLIFSELLVLCAFVFSPGIKENQVVELNEPLILIDDVPITIQNNKIISLRPKTPEIIFSDYIEDPMLLDNIIIAEKSGERSEISNQFASAENSFYKLNRRAPRQLLEVLPQKNYGNFTGIVQLKLKIDRSGKVSDHIILFNSLECEDCLNDIISSAYKSVWEPAVNNGKETEFWVEKSYTFN